MGKLFQGAGVDLWGYQERDEGVVASVQSYEYVDDSCEWVVVPWRHHSFDVYVMEGEGLVFQVN
jgi:hypothetical protein